MRGRERERESTVHCCYWLQIAKLAAALGEKELISQFTNLYRHLLECGELTEAVEVVEFCPLPYFVVAVKLDILRDHMHTCIVLSTGRFFLLFSNINAFSCIMKSNYTWISYGT